MILQQLTPTENGANSLLTINNNFSLLAPNVLSQYTIVRTVDGSSNLTVSLKDINGNDFSPTNPGCFKIGNTVRTITGALSFTANAASGSWMNLGSAELATQETDIFVYVAWDSANSVVRIGFSRISNGRVKGDFYVTDSANEKWVTLSNGNVPNSLTATDQFECIGRFNAILSAGAGYTWSIPATSIVISRPIYETRWLSWIPTFTWDGTPPSGSPTTIQLYKVIGDRCHANVFNYGYSAGTNNVVTKVSLPFTPKNYQQLSGQVCVSNTPNLTSAWADTGGYFTLYCTAVTATQIRVAGIYQI